MAKRKARKPAGPPVRAQTHTDDYEHEVVFDAAPWFAHASDQQIWDLAEIDWGGDYAADYVAEYLIDEIPALKKMFAYLRHPATRRRRDAPGFEVYVDPEDAMAWIAQNRPHMLWLGELRRPLPPGPLEWRP